MQYLIHCAELVRSEPITYREIARAVSGHLGRTTPLRSATVGQWVRGVTIPDVAVLRALATDFGVDRGWLACGAASAAPTPYPEEQAFVDARALDGATARRRDTRRRPGPVVVLPFARPWTAGNSGAPPDTRPRLPTGSRPPRGARD